IYPPHFVGPERLAVLHRRKKSKGVKEMPNFFAAMQAVDHPLEPIFCGGSDRALQEREQWSSACNFFTVRPGVALTYARNEATLRELEHAGLKTVAAGDLQAREAAASRWHSRSSNVAQSISGSTRCSIPAFRAPRGSRGSRGSPTPWSPSGSALPTWFSISDGRSKALCSWRTTPGSTGAFS